MTVSELIMNWTEEERRQHANLIIECLEREELLKDLKGKIEASEKGLIKNLEHLLTGLSQLSRDANKIADHIENIYLHLAKGQGNV
jgi:hypothetical protein